ncbi:MAG: zinc ABC transporter solute-binding protein [Epsilonproteobacteria bacterium]|nr:zinc ABC transporter solute-binding protein [Campylobacterota bacterium]
MIKYIFLLILTTVMSASQSIVVSIAPEKFFVSKITGSEQDISIMIPQGSSPATYSPKPSQLKALKDASIYFTIGVPFEKNWLERLKSVNNDLTFVDITKGISKHGKDPHVWLDPMLVKIMAKNIADTLSKKDPQNSKKYQNNYQAFAKELDILDQKIRDITSHIKQKNFIVYHPSFGYFASAYGLKQIAIENEGKAPSLKYELKIINFAKKHHIKTIFVSPAFSKKQAKFIANKVGAKVQIIDHLAVDWDQNMLKIARSFEEAN